MKWYKWLYYASAIAANVAIGAFVWTTVTEARSPDSIEPAPG